MAAEFKEGLESLVIKLHEIGAVKFGEFETKSDLRSPIQFDLHVIFQYPDVLVRHNKYIQMFIHS